MPRRFDDFIYDSFSDAEIVEQKVHKRKKSKKKHKKRKKLKLLNSRASLETNNTEAAAEENSITVADESTENDTTFSLNDDLCSDEWKKSDASPKTNRKKKQQKTKNEDDDSSEEERWLDAIESGKLEEVDDELKKIKSKDPKLMTARQRAMLERKTDKDDVSELLAKQTVKEDTKVALEKDAERIRKNLKRKQLADKKREHDKKKTMEKLLRKNKNKNAKLASKAKLKRTTPTVVYIKSSDLHVIKIPVGYEFPLIAKKCNVVPVVKKCGVAGCNNNKKYNCSKTGVPLCSLECYKLNLVQNGNIT